MPLKLRQRESRREVLVHTENSRAESATNAQGQDPPQPPPSDPNRKPYPEKYIVPTFLRFDGRKGSALVHISKFIDLMGAYAGNGDLCLREFSKSLDDRAYIWYTTLPPESVKTWEDMARKTALSVKPHTEKPKGKKSQPQVFTVSTVNNKRKKSTERPFEEPPSPVPCTLEEMIAILNKWVADGIIKLPEAPKKATEEDKKNPKFCYFHQYIHHSTADCWTLRRKFHEKIQDGTLELPHAHDADMDESAVASTTMTPTAIKTLQRNPRKIQRVPMEIKGFGGIGEYTKGHIQLVLKVGLLVALTRFHVVDSVVPYHILFGRPWLHKNQHVSSTYHQCVKGRLNGKPIRIAANPTPFDQSESHFVEVALYDEVAPVGEASFAKPIGIPLPKWEEIKDVPEADLRDLLEQKRKRREEASTSKSQPQCNLQMQLQEEFAAADPKISAKEELEVKKLLSASFIKPIQHLRWLSNIVPVRKKNDQIWCCVDFRNLNKACPKDEFSLPNMDLLIDSAVGHAMFSFMDGFNGYNQIFMSPKDAEKTAFRMPIGNFYFTVMPFGLKNFEATYQRIMTAMFHDMIHREIKDYVDDIVVKSKIKEDHFGILKKVFERCRLYKLKMSHLKCAFGVSAGKFLGFLVYQRGIDVDPIRASAIATMKLAIEWEISG
uniref:Reverse transcriptase domain-containing protein n=1 Tax=Fagus sylvatica TaxID=28930 RepID=A0A2N9FIW5_FAGSY